MSNIRAKVEGALVAGIQDWLDLVFAESQVNVPVRTGTLKKSGYRKNFRDGGQFGYRADYAGKVEEGWAGGRVTVPAHTVRSHRRTLPGYKTRSSLHKAGQGPRPRRKWQTVKQYQQATYERYQKPFRGRHYAGRAVAKYRPLLGMIVGRRLRRLSAS